jgi:HEXXH motif-containing protein
MIAFHRVPPALLVEMSSGVCGPDSLRLLSAGQLSRHLLLIRHIADAMPDAHGEDTLAVLDAARRRDPATAARVLSDPMVGAWLARTVRHLHDATEPAAGLGQLAALTAVTAARCGVEAELVMVRRGPAVMIPTMGLLAGLSSNDQPLRLRAGRGDLTALDGARTLHLPPAPGTRAGHWHDLWKLTAEPLGTMTLDDLSPGRDAYQASLTSRTSADDVAHWQHCYSGAADLLSRHAPDITAEMRQVLRTIVPLRARENHIGSATARHAFGALGATMPQSGAALAVTLVHEGRHSLLNALIELEPLFDRNDPARYFAPWRNEARPIWGLFHGVFAFLAVADMLNRLRAEPGQEYPAEREFAKLRTQLRAGLETLLAAPSLTTAGRLFADGMRTSLARLEAVTVSPAAADSAARTLSR